MDGEIDCMKGEKTPNNERDQPKHNKEQRERALGGQKRTEAEYATQWL